MAKILNDEDQDRVDDDDNDQDNDITQPYQIHFDCC